MYGVGALAVGIVLTILVNRSEAGPNYSVTSGCNPQAKGLPTSSVAYMCNSMALGSCHFQNAARSDGLDTFAEYGVGGYGSDAPSSCCRCFQISIQGIDLPEKDLIVQGVNTGGDVVHNQFDLSMIAGGFGLNNGCSNKVFSYAGGLWDGNSGPAQYSGKAGDWCSDPSADGTTCKDIYGGGIRKRADCAKLPTAETISLCQYSFDTKFRSELTGMRQTLMKEVRCPAGLRAVTGCDRDDATLPLPTKRLVAGETGVVNGLLTTMWDCCKPSCAWRENVLYSKNTAVNTCDAIGNIHGVGSPAYCKPYVCHSTCKTCSEENNANKCTSCLSGSYFSSGVCIACPPSMNCSACSSETICTVCKSGYILQSNGTCSLPCHTSCVTCSVPANELKCTTCAAGNYLDSTGACLACPSSIIGCSDCLNATTCNTCPENYTMQANKTCKATCHTACNTCSKPLDYYSCTTCFDGFILSGNTCVNCNWPCKTCSGTASICTSCVAGQRFTSSGTTCEWDPGCHSSCKDCSTGNNANACTSCAAGKYLSNGECLSCNSTCATCTNGSTCSTCPTGQTLSSENLCGTSTTPTTPTTTCHSTCATCSVPANQLKCTSCASGNFLDSTGACLACPSSIGCTDCSNATTCNSCPPNTTIQADKTCKVTGTCFSYCKTCSKSNDYFGCTSCIDGYVLASDNSCVNCNWPCKTCKDTPNYCLSCVAGQRFTSSGTTCEWDPGCHSSCKDCSTGNNANACTSCAAGKYLSNGECLSCNSTCATCTNGSTCSTCPTGQTLSSTNLCGTSTTPTTPTTTCHSSCVTCSSPANQLKCTSCQSGYFLDSTGACLACPSSIGCTDCSNATTCNSCPPNTTMQADKTCKGTGSCFSYCKTCSKPNDYFGCTSCIDGYVLAGDNSCVNCNWPCKTCKDTPNYCLSCVDGQRFAASGTTCEWDPGCHSSCKDCSTGNNQNACTSCAAGKYLSNGQCLSCNSTCASCTNGSTCSTCPTGQSLTTANLCGTSTPPTTACHASCVTCSTPANSLKCTSCASGNYLDSTGACLICPSSIGCTDCLSATTCKSCPANTTMQANKTCKVTCHASCMTCAKPLDNFSCTACFDGFVLSGNNSCINCASPCKTCKGTQNNCTSCSTGFRLAASGTTCEQDCHSSCKGCSLSNNANACTSCAAGKYLSNGQCLSCNSTCATCSNGSTCSTCPTGQSLTTTNLCGTQTPPTTACHASCVTCSTPANSLKCTSCASGNYLNSTGACLTCPSSIGCTDCLSATTCKSCPANTTMQADKTCKGTCHASCMTCAKPQDNFSCTACFDGYILSGNNSCINCNWPCKTCKGTQNYCTSCATGYRFAASGTTCQQDCHSSCKDCSVGNNANACISCASGKYLSNGQCLSCNSTCATCSTGSTCLTCPTGLSLTIANLCATPVPSPVLTCHSSCKSCSSSNNANSCTSCVQGNFLTGNTCVPCSSNCATCSGSPMNCMTCPSGKLLSGSTCVSVSMTCHNSCKTCSAANDQNACTSCTAGKFLQGKICSLCSTSCLTCGNNNSSYCLSCASGKVLVGNKCLPVYTGIQPCHSSCSTCFTPNNATQCATCPDGRRLTSGFTCI